MNDLTGIPIAQRLALHAERHYALWHEAAGLAHAHDALAQCRDERDKAETELAALTRQQQRFECKLQDLYRQWKELEAPSRSTKLLVKLRNPRRTEQAFAERDTERKQKEDEHQHAFWQGLEYRRAVEEAEARLGALGADVGRYELLAANHTALADEVRAIHARVFAGAHLEYADELELRDRIDTTAAHGVELGDKLEVERRALGLFPAMLDAAERSERQFRKAQSPASDRRRMHACKAEDAYRLARKREAELRALKPSVAACPGELPSFSFLDTGDWTHLFRTGFAEREAFCRDLVAHMRQQRGAAERDVARLEHGIRHLDRHRAALQRQLERMRARILLNTAADMGLGEHGDVPETPELDRLALEDDGGDSFEESGLGLIGAGTPPDDAPPPAYSKHASAED